ncbi:MAG: hypothetical protein HGA87_03050 [Desulfobulbaceae bacterium]|nr:hypothetical protein [Desulfobulbaceae bacterium]
MNYTYAKLSSVDLGVIRILGSGLGNLLFPWARSLVFAQKNNMIPIAPTWEQFKIGPILRNEPDKRFYFGLFRMSKRYIGGWKKLFLLSTLPKINEEGFVGCLNDSRNSGIVIFEGHRTLFQDVMQDYNMVRRELIDMTLPEHKKGLEYNFKESISVHVRLGDFNNDLRLPIGWYVQMVSAIRNKIGTDMPVYIFSDGTDEELHPLLAMQRAERIGFGSSIGDLLALSQANMLIASASTFSMWASYLGRMPVIWHQGRLRQRIYYDNPNAEVECIGEEGISQSFFEIVQERNRKSRL